MKSPLEPGYNRAYNRLNFMHSKQKMKDRIAALRLCCVVGVFGAFGLAGCAAHPGAPGPPVEQPLCLKSADTAQVMEVAEGILGRMYFTVEKADLEHGYMRTKPLAGGQFFEIWRQDNRTAAAALRSNLHSVERVVELKFAQQNGETCVWCDVYLRRLSLPERRVHSTTGAYTLFSRGSPALLKLQLSPEQKEAMTWVELGQDKQLEAEILSRIDKLLSEQQ